MGTQPLWRESNSTCPQKWKLHCWELMNSQKSQRKSLNTSVAKQQPNNCTPFLPSSLGELVSKKEFHTHRGRSQTLLHHWNICSKTSLTSQHTPTTCHAPPREHLGIQAMISKNFWKPTMLSSKISQVTGTGHQNPGNPTSPREEGDQASEAIPTEAEATPSLTEETSEEISREEDLSVKPEEVVGRPTTLKDLRVRENPPLVGTVKRRDTCLLSADLSQVRADHKAETDPRAGTDSKGEADPPVLTDPGPEPDQDKVTSQVRTDQKDNPRTMPEWRMKRTEMVKEMAMRP